MSTISDECRLSFYEDITPLNLKENKQFWLVRNKQSGKYFVKKRLSNAHREVYNAIRGITSKNLPRIYECISFENEFIVIEEFINGDSIYELVQQGKMNPICAAGIMKDICNVLFILHSLMPPIIHRDIKPENIILTNDGIVKLMDFDIARTFDKNKNHDTEYMGTVGYAAPEHFGFGQTDARSDIYSCGMVLNYLMTGQLPESKLADSPFGNIVKKCIQLNPEHRYQDVFELRQAIDGCFNNNTKHMPDNNTPINEHGNAQSNINNTPDAVVNKPENSSNTQTWKKFLPPGFRSRKIWKIMVALVFYAMIIDMAATGDFKSNSKTELILTRIFSGIGYISSVFVFFNYLGVADRLPGVQRFSKKVSYMLRLIYAFLTLILILSLLMVLLDFIQ